MINCGNSNVKTADTGTPTQAGLGLRQAQGDLQLAQRDVVVAQGDLRLAQCERGKGEPKTMGPPINEETNPPPKVK